VTQDRVQWHLLVNTVINELLVSMKGGNFLTSQVTVSSSKRTLLYGVTWLLGY